MGNRKGQYSIRINDQWRICFDWDDRALGPSWQSLQSIRVNTWRKN
jgi:plasmid maintenance system killer protein